MRTPAACRTLALFAATALVMLAAAGQARADFGVTPGSFVTSVVDQGGLGYSQAGGHPYSASTSFAFNSVVDPDAGTIPEGGGVRDIQVDLPPGLVANPQAVEQCPVALLGGITPTCPVASRVGTLELTWVTLGLSNPEFGVPDTVVAAVYNVAPPRGSVALLGFNFLGKEVLLYVSVRSDGDYGVRAEGLGVNPGIKLLGIDLTLYGDPATVFATGPSRPFLSNPTECSGGATVTTLAANSWEDPGDVLDYTAASPPVTGCDQLSFEPRISIVPETERAATPGGYTVDLVVPQTDDVGELATPPLRDATVRFPRGVSINPSLADGLQGCADDEFGEHDGRPNRCPLASKIGTVLVTTPLIDHPLPGAIYLRQPEPEAERYAVLLAIEDPISGLIVKLGASIVPDPQTGRLTAEFEDVPQLPVEELHLEFKGGPNGAFVNPGPCGAYVTESRLSPWAGPESVAATPSSRFQVDSGPGGGPCPSGRFAPGFEAGSTSAVAGGSSGFTLRVTRGDDEQDIAALDVTLPSGLSAKLAGLPVCGDAEATSGNCPAASRVGTSTVGIGAGANPLYLPQAGAAPAAVYLAGPYRGAPYSLLLTVPAQAGPFDLGAVVVRSALEVNPRTAQVTIRSDPFPQILGGIPMAYRDIRIDLTKSDFILNPTSCAPTAVGGRITSVQGAGEDVSSRFQVGDCDKLAFKPRLALRLLGPTHRGAHPKLQATLTPRPGDANIGRATLTLPRTELVDYSHIRTICTRPRYAAHTCPAGSIYGYAKVWTPLLDQPLQGPVYLRSSNHRLPDLVASLDGQIHIDLAGHIDSVGSRVRASFPQLPDVPLSKLILKMRGGKKGLLANNTELCRALPRATAVLRGQNGRRRTTRPLMVQPCGRARPK
jgi:hypothetical protein